MLGLWYVHCFALTRVAQADDALIGLRSLVLTSGMDLGVLREEELRNWRKWPEQQER